SPSPGLVAELRAQHRDQLVQRPASNPVADHAVTEGAETAERWTVAAADPHRGLVSVGSDCERALEARQQPGVGRGHPADRELAGLRAGQAEVEHDLLGRGSAALAVDAHLDREAPSLGWHGPCGQDATRL